MRGGRWSTTSASSRDRRTPQARGRVLRQDPFSIRRRRHPRSRVSVYRCPRHPSSAAGSKHGAVAGLLRFPEVRLLTLTGVGGSARHALRSPSRRRWQGEYADGAHFVNLAPLAQPELVIGAVARALGMSEAGGQTVLETLVENLRDRETLLVTDNFEHVSAAAPAG